MVKVWYESPLTKKIEDNSPQVSKIHKGRWALEKVVSIQLRARTGRGKAISSAYRSLGKGFGPKVEVRILTWGGDHPIKVDHTEQTPNALADSHDKKTNFKLLVVKFKSPEAANVIIRSGAIEFNAHKESSCTLYMHNLCDRNDANASANTRIVPRMPLSGAR
jgi:hypothetical protein